MSNTNGVWPNSRFNLTVSQCKWVSGVDTYEAEIAADLIIWELFARKSAECLNLGNSFITISSETQKCLTEIWLCCEKDGSPSELHCNGNGRFLLWWKQCCHWNPDNKKCEPKDISMCFIQSQTRPQN